MPTIVAWIVLGALLASVAWIAARTLAREKRGASVRATRVNWRIALFGALLSWAPLYIALSDVFAAALCTAGVILLLTGAVGFVKILERAMRRRKHIGEFHPLVGEVVKAYWRERVAIRRTMDTYPVAYGMQLPGVLVLLGGLLAVGGCMMLHMAQTWWVLSWFAVGIGALWCALAFLKTRVELVMSADGISVTRSIWGFAPWLKTAAWSDVRFVALGADKRQQSLTICARGLWLVLQRSVHAENGQVKARQSEGGDDWYPLLAEAVLESIQARQEEGIVVFLSAARVRLHLNALHSRKEEGTRNNADIDTSQGIHVADGYPQD